MQRALLHTVVAGLVRRTWVVTIVAVLACSALSARAVAALVEARYLVDSDAPPLAARTGVASPTGSVPRSRSDGALVARNMFCSTCEPSRGSDPTNVFSPSAVLIATSIGALPRATLRSVPSDVQGSWGVGDDVPHVGMIERIGFASIDVLDRATGRRGTLWLRGETGAATPGSAAGAAGAAATDPWDGRLRKIDDRTFEVDRELVRDLVSGGMKPGAARVVPVAEHGALVGLRVVAAQPTSIGGALGLRPGDMLQGINGTHIESAQTLLDVYAKLDQLNVVQLEGAREGKPLTIELRLR
jgi:hypothetical protein